MTVKFVANRNNRKVFGKIEGIEKLTRRGMRQAMSKVGHTILDEANREILKGSKTGKVYIRRDSKGRRRRHKSSAQGETHANFSGTLRRSRSFQMHGTTSLEVGYGVSSGKDAPEYARAIEFGFKGRNLKPRPSIKNALTSQQGNITQHFEREILDELK